jgi:hypothetical protein
MSFVDPDPPAENRLRKLAARACLDHSRRYTASKVTSGGEAFDVPHSRRASR